MVMCAGDSLGHAWCGLLLARTFDPFLQTPVPLAFMAKMVLSIAMPLSAVKNQASVHVAPCGCQWCPKRRKVCS
jgi:hypothetical protein